MGVLPDHEIRRHCKIVPMAEGIKRPNTISYGLSSYGYDVRAGYVFKVFSNVWGAVVDPKKFDEKAFVEFDLTPHDGKHWFDSRGECKWCGQPCTLHLKEKCSQRQQPLDHILIPPNSFALAETIEHFEIPRDCLTLVIGKSTYARCGIVLNCTPLEPEWRGKVTLEISNTTPLPAKVYAGEGIGQVLFLRTDGVETAILDALLREFDNMPHNANKAMLIAALPRGMCEQSYADKNGKYQDQKQLTLPKVD